MNLTEATGRTRLALFRAWRNLATRLPGRRSEAFGKDPNHINAILVINLSRQSTRLRLLMRELGRFRSADGETLSAMTRRFAAVDARDGLAVAATVDVDSVYHVGDQLYVQPDARLARSFGANEPVRMTRQEVAVARSHIELWKSIAEGTDDHVLILEDDVWFRAGARRSIDKGWRDAVAHSSTEQGPEFLYLSYAVADPNAEREQISRALFRPTRGLWFLSAYVISRGGAAALLRAMPVVGPVDLWVNYRLVELDAFALTAPALAQRSDVASGNSYSILPYLARAGIVDSVRDLRPAVHRDIGPILGWSTGAAYERLAMALSMLGFRVRVFDGDEHPLGPDELRNTLDIFDVLVDPPLDKASLASILLDETAMLVAEQGASVPAELSFAALGRRRTVVVGSGEHTDWGPLCRLLALDTPADPFPAGAPRSFRAFRADRMQLGFTSTPDCSGDLGPGGNAVGLRAPASNEGEGGKGRGANRLRLTTCQTLAADDTPWVLPTSSSWFPRSTRADVSDTEGRLRVDDRMNDPSSALVGLEETFPGNQAMFRRANLKYRPDGVHLRLGPAESGNHRYDSGALASAESFTHGRFEAGIRPTRGAGIITGLFLHRALPRQEIDIEFVGAEPRRMLTNVYFNPGDDGTSLSYGYRGSPYWVELGFDFTAEFHTYGIDWRPESISWLVDGRVVHQRTSWDPTPVPHLPMRLHMNVWVPRSRGLAGELRSESVPAEAVVRDVRITS